MRNGEEGREVLQTASLPHRKKSRETFSNHHEKKLGDLASMPSSGVS
jgi:hypothetical protein